MKFVFALPVLLITLQACSQKSESPPAPAPSTGPATVPPAPASQGEARLTPEQMTRLVRAHSPVLGPAKAPVTLVEFLDPACSACKAYAPVVKQIRFLYPEEVRVVVRFAAFHPGSEEAIRVLDAARAQGKFEPVLQALFDRQDEWSAHGSPRPELAWTIAASQGVDLAQARRHAASAEAGAMMKTEADDVIALQVKSTPTFYVNGRQPDVFGSEQLMDLVKLEVNSALGD